MGNLKEKEELKERRKYIDEILRTVERIKLRLRLGPIWFPVPDGKIVMEKELPKLKELLEKVI